MSDKKTISEQEFAEYLMEAIDLRAEEDGEDLPEVDTFAGAGILTSNKGLVVRLGGAEFQLTIVRSR